MVEGGAVNESDARIAELTAAIERNPDGREEVYALRVRVVRQCALRGRETLIGDLASLTPVIVALGGDRAAAGAFGAMRDIARWWP